MAVEAIGRATAFVEANLTEDISVADMADAAGYSLYHFCRTFSSTAFLTPYDYLIRRRLTRAACDLMNSDVRGIDVALAYQFKNQETFLRAFKRMFGILPSQARQKGSIDPRKMLPFLTEGHLQAFRACRPVRVEKAALVLVGVMSPLKPDSDEKAAVWDMLRQIVPVNDSGIWYGITCYPPEWELRGRLYFAGIADTGEIGKQSLLVKKELPAQDYVCLQGGECALDYLYAVWL